MAVIVLNYPVKMISLSEAALRRSNGKQHLVSEILGSSRQVPTGKNTNPDIAPGRPRRDLTDTYHVRTFCGQSIDAYPETDQGVEPCARCMKSKKDIDQARLIRLLKPVSHLDGFENWERCYWEWNDPGYVRTLVEKSRG